MMLTSKRKRARMGAQWLDYHLPGWHQDRIRLDRLDLQSGHSCVLGQLHGDFSTGLKWMGRWPRLAGSPPAMRRYLRHRNGHDLPCVLGFNLCGGSSQSHWATLTRHWQREIKYRRAEDALRPKPRARAEDRRVKVYF